MQRGWLRVMVRYPLAVLVEQGRLTQAEAAQAVAEALLATEGVAVHRATVHRILRQEEKGRSLPRHRRPARRFEMRAFGELWQMDTTVGAWLEGYRRGGV